MRSKTMLVGVGVVVGLLLSAAGIVLAGSLNPSAGPTAAGSQMYTLQQIYTRLTGGGDATKMTTFTEPSGAPGSTMRTLDEIYNLALPARVPKTGQTTCYDAAGTVIACASTGQDGNLLKGVAWPNPRFTDNSNGTVTDNLTGLIWLKNASCFGIQTWANALVSATTLANGACGLNDSSVAGDWRPPNVREMQSLVHYGFGGFVSPAVPNTAGTGQWTEGNPFTGLQSAVYYWSSTTAAENPGAAWVVRLNDVSVINGGKTYLGFYVWPVRGGQ